MSTTPDRDLVPPLVGLTVVTGLVDAFSYLVLGNVFVANMTGNVVFLGFALAGARASRSLLLWWPWGHSPLGRCKEADLARILVTMQSGSSQLSASSKRSSSRRRSSSPQARARLDPATLATR